MDSYQKDQENVLIQNDSISHPAKPHYAHAKFLGIIVPAPGQPPCTEILLNGNQEKQIVRYDRVSLHITISNLARRGFDDSEYIKAIYALDAILSRS